MMTFKQVANTLARRDAPGAEAPAVERSIPVTPEMLHDVACLIQAVIHEKVAMCQTCGTIHRLLDVPPGTVGLWCTNCRCDRTFQVS